MAGRCFAYCCLVFCFGSWFGREIKYEDFCFCDVMQSDRGLFTTKSWGRVGRGRGRGEGERRGGGLLGQFLPSMCRWFLRIRTFFFSLLCDPIFVTFGET